MLFGSKLCALTLFSMVSLCPIISEWPPSELLNHMQNICVRMLLFMATNLFTRKLSLCALRRFHTREGNVMLGRADEKKAAYNS